VIEAAKKTNVKLHITHVSTKASIELIKNAKSLINITCDTTPNYLFLTEADTARLGELVKVNPRLRTKEDQVALWNCLTDGTIDMITTDHAPHTIAEKHSNHPPSGIPGLDTMMPLMINAVLDGRLSFNELARLTSTNPAQIWRFMLKGKIDLGFNADMIIVDTSSSYIIDKTKLFTKSGYSPYEGRTLKGKIIFTIVNGEIVYENNDYSE